MACMQGLSLLVHLHATAWRFSADDSRLGSCLVSISLCVCVCVVSVSALFSGSHHCCAHVQRCRARGVAARYAAILAFLASLDFRRVAFCACACMHLSLI